MNTVQILPLVISATGLIPTSLTKNIKTLNLKENTTLQIQKSVILNTCNIVRSVLNIDNDTPHQAVLQSSEQPRVTNNTFNISCEVETWHSDRSEEHTSELQSRFD